MVFMACGIGHKGQSVPETGPSRAESDTKANLCHPGSGGPRSFPTHNCIGWFSPEFDRKLCINRCYIMSVAEEEE